MACVTFVSDYIRDWNNAINQRALAYPEGGGVERGSTPPPLNRQKFLNCVFAKYTVQALFL